MMGREGCMRWFALVCFLVVCKESSARKQAVSCSQICQSAGVPNGCQRPPKQDTLEEVVVVADQSAHVKSWEWETIHMVVSKFVTDGKHAHPACLAHSNGKRFGLWESVIYDDYQDQDQVFAHEVVRKYQLLQADNIVYDLLNFFSLLETMSDKSEALGHIAHFLQATNLLLQKVVETETYCVLPWVPPGIGTDSALSDLLTNCDVLMLSPDSFNPQHGKEECVAQATIPIPKFLYGIERYISLYPGAFTETKIVAGIPWHGYVYTCESLVGSKCIVSNTTSNSSNCFDESNRQRLRLAQIYDKISTVDQKLITMDSINQGIRYNLNDSAQLWYENTTTLYLKYQLVRDLHLRGLSIWYGDDLEYRASVAENIFTNEHWNFLMHQILHKSVFKPPQPSHYYADTVAGVGVGCLLLGTALGVTFACIAFRRDSCRRPIHRPFKLDEDEDGFRDDEGL